MEASANQGALFRELVAERIGWLLIAVTLASSLMGFLGPGLACHQTAVSSDASLAVKYYAIERRDAPAELRIAFRAAADSTVIGIAFSRDFVDRLSFQSSTPSPESVELQKDLVVYRYRVSVGGERSVVSYRYETGSFGRLNYEIGLPPESRVQVSQFILP